MAVKEWLPATARLAAIDHKLKVGESLFRLGEKTLGLCEVIAGRVRLARVDRSGREIVLHEREMGRVAQADRAQGDASLSDS